MFDGSFSFGRIPLFSPHFICIRRAASKFGLRSRFRWLQEWKTWNCYQANTTFTHCWLPFGIHARLLHPSYKEEVEDSHPWHFRYGPGVAGATMQMMMSRNWIKHLLSCFRGSRLTFARSPFILASIPPNHLEMNPCLQFWSRLIRLWFFHSSRNSLDGPSR